MEEEPFHSRKRRRPSSQAPNVIFTRSRSELFIHRNRSGRAWVDPNPKHKLSPYIRIQRSGSSPRTSTNGREPIDDSCRGSSCVLIKDLRSRRVFSPASVDGECSPNKRAKVRADPDGFQSPKSSDTQMEVGFDGNGGIEPNTDGVSGSDKELIHTAAREDEGDEKEIDSVDMAQVVENPPNESTSCDDMCSGEGFCATGEACYDEEKINNVVESILSRVDCSSEDWIHTALRGSDIFPKSDTFEHRGNESVIDSIDTDAVVDNPSNDCIATDNRLSRGLCVNGGVCYEERRMDGGTEAISGSFSDFEWIQQYYKSDGQEEDLQEGGKGRGIDSIDADCAMESPSNPSILCGNPCIDEAPCTLGEVCYAQNIENGIQVDQRSIDGLGDESTQLLRNIDLLCKSIVQVDGGKERGIDTTITNINVKNNSSSTTISADNPCTNEGVYTGGVVCDEEQKINEGTEEMLGGIEPSGEEWIQTTPPDIEVLSKSILRDGGNEKGINLIDADHIVDNPLSISTDNLCDDEGFCQSRKDTTKTVVKTTQGLVRCSRLKLFQTPNSLSYRRLLPFLMDLARETDSPLEIHSCQNLCSEKTKKVADERTQLQLLDSHSCETELGSDETDTLSRQHHVDSVGTPVTGRLGGKVLNGLVTLNENPKENNPDDDRGTPLTIDIQENNPDDGLGTMTGNLKENSLDNGIGTFLPDEPKEHCIDGLEAQSTEKMMEKSVDTVGISMTNLLKEMSVDTVESTVNDTLIETSPPASSSDFSIAECSTLISFKESVTKIPDQNASGNYVTLYDPAISCSATASPHDQAVPQSSCKFDLDHDAVVSTNKNGLPCEPLSVSPTFQEALPMELANDIEDHSNLSRKSIEGCITLESALSTDVKPSDSSNVECSSQFEVSVPSERPLLAPTKGILKTRPNACRGLCMCPDCYSFRLHVEKANEFSRKQMQDAEQVAVGLMKELSTLKSVMEKSIMSTSDGVRDKAMVQLDQIKRFCMRASRAEELARNRLRQMTRDLNIHCRITTMQQPKVRFGDN